MMLRVIEMDTFYTIISQLFFLRHFVYLKTFRGMYMCYHWYVHTFSSKLMPWKIKKKLLRMDPKIEPEWIMQMQICWDGSDMNIFKMKLIKNETNQRYYVLMYSWYCYISSDLQRELCNSHATASSERAQDEAVLN